MSTILAVLLDVFIKRKEARLGAYTKPEDDQDAQRLREVKRAHNVSKEYDLPEEQQNYASGWGSDDRDHTYHSGYGAERPMGPLDSTAGDVGGGYRDRI